MGFVAGHGHCQTAGLFGILDFHIAIAKRQQLFPADPVLAQNPFDHDFFGERFVVVPGAVDVLAEIAS